MTDTFRTWDAAYVLGALTPDDRHTFERHLETCDDCSRAVAELAGIPGLLSRTDLSDVEFDAEPPPPDLLPSVLGEVRRRRQRKRTRWLAAAVAACILACALLFLGPASAPFRQAPVVAMTQIVPGPVTATVRLDEQSWGTRIELVCAYDKAAKYGERNYKLVVVPRDGTAQELARWKSLPGQDFTMKGATSLRRNQIASLEVQTTDGRPLLRLPA